MNYIIYLGGSGTNSQLSGAFIQESSITNFYLYTDAGNLTVDTIPAGSGVSSYLYGNFDYFTYSSITYT